MNVFNGYYFTKYNSIVSQNNYFIELINNLNDKLFGFLQATTFSQLLLLCFLIILSLFVLKWFVDIITFNTKSNITIEYIVDNLIYKSLWNNIFIKILILMFSFYLFFQPVLKIYVDEHVETIGKEKIVTGYKISKKNKINEPEYDILIVALFQNLTQKIFFGVSDIEVDVVVNEKLSNNHHKFLKLSSVNNQIYPVTISFFTLFGSEANASNLYEKIYKSFDAVVKFFFTLEEEASKKESSNLIDNTILNNQKRDNIISKDRIKQDVLNDFNELLSIFDKKAKLMNHVFFTQGKYYSNEYYSGEEYARSSHKYISLFFSNINLSFDRIFPNENINFAYNSSMDSVVYDTSIHPQRGEYKNTKLYGVADLLEQRKFLYDVNVKPYIDKKENIQSLVKKYNSYYLLNDLTTDTKGLNKEFKKLFFTPISSNQRTDDKKRAERRKKELNIYPKNLITNDNSLFLDGGFNFKEKQVYSLGYNDLDKCIDVILPNNEDTYNIKDFNSKSSKFVDIKVSLDNCLCDSSEICSNVGTFKDFYIHQKLIEMNDLFNNTPNFDLNSIDKILNKKHNEISNKLNSTIFDDNNLDLSSYIAHNKIIFEKLAYVSLLNNVLKLQFNDNLEKYSKFVCGSTVCDFSNKSVAKIDDIINSSIDFLYQRKFNTINGITKTTIFGFANDPIQLAFNQPNYLFKYVRKQDNNCLVDDECNKIDRLNTFFTPLDSDSVGLSNDENGFMIEPSFNVNPETISFIPSNVLKNTVAPHYFSNNAKAVIEKIHKNYPHNIISYDNEFIDMKSKPVNFIECDVGIENNKNSSCDNNIECHISKYYNNKIMNEDTFIKKICSEPISKNVFKLDNLLSDIQSEYKNKYGNPKNYGYMDKEIIINYTNNLKSSKSSKYHSRYNVAKNITRHMYINNGTVSLKQNFINNLNNNFSLIKEKMNLCKDTILNNEYSGDCENLSPLFNSSDNLLTFNTILSDIDSFKHSNGMEQVDKAVKLLIYYTKLINLKGGTSFSEATFSFLDKIAHKVSDFFDYTSTKEENIDFEINSVNLKNFKTNYEIFFDPHGYEKNIQGINFDKNLYKKDTPVSSWIARIINIVEYVLIILSKISLILFMIFVGVVLAVLDFIQIIGFKTVIPLLIISYLIIYNIDDKTNTLVDKLFILIKNLSIFVLFVLLAVIGINLLLIILSEILELLVDYYAFFIIDNIANLISINDETEKILTSFFIKLIPSIISISIPVLAYKYKNKLFNSFIYALSKPISNLNSSYKEVKNTVDKMKKTFKTNNNKSNKTTFNFKELETKNNNKTNVDDNSNFDKK